MTDSQFIKACQSICELHYFGDAEASFIEYVRGQIPELEIPKSVQQTCRIGMGDGLAEIFGIAIQSDIATEDLSDSALRSLKESWLKIAREAAKRQADMMVEAVLQSLEEDMLCKP